MSGTRDARKRGNRATREAFFVLVDDGEGNMAFFNATDYIGKPMPFTKPQATCAMRAGNDVVGFSLLRLTKGNTATITEKPITIPRGPLARLERRSAMHQESAPLTADELVVEISTRLPYDRDADKDRDGGDTKEPSPDLADIFDAPAPPAGPEEPPPATGGADLETLLLDGDDADTKPEAPKRRPPRPSRVDTYRCRIRRDENNVAFLEELADDDTLIEVPRGAMNVSLYLRSPAVDRTLAIGFIGPLGRRPGTFESITRIASLVLNTVTRMTEFRVLANIETVATPAEPARAAAMSKPVGRVEETAEFPIRLYLFDANLQPLVAGDVAVAFDLENANPSTSRLLVHYTPDENIAPVFEQYKPVVDMQVTKVMRQHLGDDQLADITYDIVLGAVDSGTVARLREVGERLTALDVSPADAREHVG